MYIKIHSTKASSESDLESEKSTEIIPHTLQIPDSVNTVICRIEESQLSRAKEDLREQLDDIMLQVNRIINRYQGGIELNTFRKKRDFSFIEKDFKKNRVNILEEIYQHIQSADVKERILAELLSWLEDWHSVLSEATISEEDETDYYRWISDMEALPQALSATELNMNSLIAFSIYFLKDKKRYKKRLASKGTMWKTWREKVLRKPSAGSPLKPEQMIKEEALTNNKVSEILGMLQELISSNMFNKGEVNAIKYISSTAANLHKALGFQNQEIKNLIFQCTTMGSEIKEYYGLEKQTFQRTIQILTDKNEALEKELQNQEEKCMELLQAKANLLHQLSLANAGANLPSEETIRKRRNMLLKIQEKIKQEFEETVSSEETSQVDLPSVPEYQEVARSEPSSRRLARGTGIKWESSKDKGGLSLDSKSSSLQMPPTSKIKGDSSLVSKSSSLTMPSTSKVKGDLSLDSKSSSSIMPPTSPAKTPIKSSKDASEDRSRTPSPEIFSPRKAPVDRTKLPKPKGKMKGSPEEVSESKSQESKGENGFLTDISKMSRCQELSSEPPERKRRKEIQSPQEDEVESVAKLGESQAQRKKQKERESPLTDEEVPKTTESLSFEEISVKEAKSDGAAKQKATKKGKGKKEKTVPEAYQNDEQQILQDYEKALMSFLQQKIDNLGKGGSKSEFKEQVQPKNPETQKSLKIVRGKMEEYFQKMAEILTNILKKYKEKQSEKPGDPTKPSKKGSLLLPTPQALLNLSEKMDPVLSNLLKVLLSVADNVKEEAGERGGKARRERKEQEDKVGTELVHDQSSPKHQGMQFIKQLQEERRLWKETQEQIQRKFQQENAWFQRQDEKRRWELKQRQWQAEEELWLEMQQQWRQQEKEHKQKQKQWEIEAAQHQMLVPQELERWKEQIAQKYQEQVELQLQKMRRQEEELQKLYPENFREWRKVKQQMAQEQRAQRVSQHGGPQTQEPLTLPPEGEETLALPLEGESLSQMMMPGAMDEVTPGQDISGLRGADLPRQEGYDETYLSPYPPPGIPTKLPVMEPQPGTAPGEMPVYTTAPQESPISWAPRYFGEDPVSWGLPTPTTSRYLTTSGEAPTSGASSVPGETLLFQEPVAPEEITRTCSSAALEQPPTLRPPLTTGQLGQPLPSRLPAIPGETATLLGPAAPREAPVSWATPHFGSLQNLEALIAPEQLQMSWVPTATGQLQASWVPADTAQSQMSWASAVSGQPQVSWASTVHGQPQMSWAPAVSGQPQTSWAPGQPQVSWSTVEPQQVSPTPVAPGQFQASWDSRQPPPPVDFAAPGEPPSPVTLAAPGPPPIPMAPAVPGQPPTPVALAALGESPIIPVTFAAPGEPPIPEALAALGEPSTSVTFAAPGEASTSVTFTAPGEPLTPVALAALGEPSIIPVTYAVPGQSPTPVVFAGSGQPPMPVAPAVPGQSPTPVVFPGPGLPPMPVAPAVPGQPPTPVVFAGPGQPPIPVAPAVPGQPPTPVVFAGPGLPPIPVAPAVPGQPPTPVVFAGPGLPPVPVAPAVPGQPPTPVVFAGPGLPPIPVAPAAPGQPPTPVVFAAPGQPTTSVAPGIPEQPPTLWHPAAPEETYVPQFTPSLGQMVPPGRQLLKPLVPDSHRQSLTALQLSALEKLSLELAPSTSLKPFLGPPSAPKFEMPLFLPTSGKPPTEWSPGILKRTQPHTPQEESGYKALSPQPPFVAEHSFPAVKFSKSPPPPSAEFLQISQLVSSAHISPKVCLPPIDNKLLRSSSFTVTEKSRTTVSPPCPRDFFASAPPPEESRYFIDIEGQRKNLRILSRAVEGLQFPLILYDAVKELINKMHYLNLNRLGCLFRKYIAYRLIQSARQNIVNRIKAIRNSGKGQEAQILYVFLNRLDGYLKKVMETWTVKQRIMEHRRNICTTKMIDLYGQIKKRYNIKLNYPVPLVIHKKEPDHPLKAVCFKHVVQWSLPEKVEKKKEFEIFKALEKQKDKVEAIWRTDVSSSSYPIETKTPMKLLWDQVGGYPDIPRLLELDIHSTFRKSLASIQSSF
uniref:Protein FAM186A isoform X3 n=1 Tax=Phascolarctos cinereus TaxID=38626 RepID=A0A6P5IKM3_PHACI|nr:protein FAM186A isoform X3 [Phascolarctos cinereus]